MQLEGRGCLRSDQWFPKTCSSEDAATRSRSSIPSPIPAIYMSSSYKPCALLDGVWVRNRALHPLHASNFTSLKTSPTRTAPTWEPWVSGQCFTAPKWHLLCFPCIYFTRYMALKTRALFWQSHETCNSVLHFTVWIWACNSRAGHSAQPGLALHLDLLPSVTVSWRKEPRDKAYCREAPRFSVSSKQWGLAVVPASALGIQITQAQEAGRRGSAVSGLTQPREKLLSPSYNCFLS